MNAPYFQKHNLRGMDLGSAASKAYPYLIVEGALKAHFGDQAVEFPDQKGILAVPNGSDDIGSAIPLGPVGTGYQTIQFQQMVQEAVGDLVADGLIAPIAGGFIQGLKGAWMQLSVPDSFAEISPNFPMEQYVNLFTGFTGNLPGKLTNGGICIVCQNTCYAAMGEASELNVSVRHTINAVQRLQQHQKHLQTLMQEYQVMVGQYRQLAGKAVTTETLVNYITDAVTAGDFATLKDPKISTRTSNNVRYVIELLDSPKAVSGSGRGTLWHGFNAVTEYLSHGYGRDEESRFEAVHLGAAKRIGERAMSKALELV